MSAAPWIAGLIGRPYLRGGTGPECFDCRGLVAWVLREHYRLPVPALLQGRPEHRLAGALGPTEPLAGWRCLPGETPREADILVLRGRGAHVGIFVPYGELGLLHSVEPPAVATGVRFDPLEALLAGGFSRPALWRYLGG
jgi:cell wall-associated NlpC family hydrolase